MMKRRFYGEIGRTIFLEIRAFLWYALHKRQSFPRECPFFVENLPRSQIEIKRTEPKKGGRTDV